MKFIFCLLVVLATTKECENKKVMSESKKSEAVNMDKAQLQQNDYTLEYTAITRGTFKEISINKDSITLKLDRNSKPVTKECTNELWSKISKSLDELDLKGLSNLEAPTQKRLYDGAAHATLKITSDGETYTTPSFDHGFPPKEIKILCDNLTELID